MGQGLKAVGGNPASPPYRNGPYTWDQQVTFAQGSGSPIGEGDTWYVDGTNGASGNNGKSWTTAMITIQAAITAAGPGDTVFITAKDITDGTGEPTSYEENVIIPLATSNLSVIGVSRGRTQGGLPQMEDGTGTTDAILKVQAPGCLIANLGFNGAGNTGGGILLDDDYSTKSAFGTSIIGCHFKNCKGHSTHGSKGGAIMWGTAGNAWQVLIDGNTFYKNVCDICIIGTSNTVPQDVTIQNNSFSDSPASTDCNIYTGGSGFGGGLLIKDNTFGGLPALSSGDVALYAKILISGTSASGMFCGNYFGSLGTTAGWGSGKAECDIEDGIWTVNNRTAAGVIVREAT